MKSYALTIDLVDDPTLIEQYKIEHTRVWPEVLERIKEVGIQQMKIWLLGTRMFMCIETDDDFDVARDFGRVNEQAKSAEWNKWMAETFQRRPPGAKEGELWAVMELAFDLKAALGESTN